MLHAGEAERVERTVEVQSPSVRDQGKNVEHDRHIV
jgi:hypothetical protein